MGLTYDQLFPGRFIKAGEMHGKPVTLTIADVILDTLEQEDGREKQQAIVVFTQTKREWALNKTNAQCLVAMWGQDSGDWIGKRVTLFPERDVSGMSDSGLCLRVKGSPDIKKTIKAQIKLPRRRPVERTLVPTGNDKLDTATGEVFTDAGDATEAALSGDEAPEDVVTAAKHVLGATEAESDDDAFLESTDKLAV